MLICGYGPDYSEALHTYGRIEFIPTLGWFPCYTPRYPTPPRWVWVGVPWAEGSQRLPLT